MPEDLGKIRKRKGMSINQLASRSGISIAVLVQYEKGEREISSADLSRLAKVLYVSEWDINPRSTPPPREAKPDKPPRPKKEAAKERKPRPKSPPARESQITHMLTLAARFGIDRAALEEEIGKPLEELTQKEARHWNGHFMRRVAEEIFIPFSVGGGIRTIEHMRQVLLAGAEKVSVNTAAVHNPKIIAEGARAFGSQCIVLGMDVKKVGASLKIPSGYEIVIHGGRTYTGIDALVWAKEAENLGAGEICLNAIDADGTQQGYEMALTPLISENVNIPVIASGGAGDIDHIYYVLTRGKADAALVASIVHYGTYTVKQIKDELHVRGVKVRMRW